MEKQLLNASLKSRTSHALIKEHISPQAKNKKDVRYSPEFRILMDKIDAYYSNDQSAVEVDRTLFEEMIDASVANAKHRDRFKTIVDEALSSDVSVPNVTALVRMAKRHEIGDKLAVRLANREDASDLIAEYTALQQDEVAGDSEDDSVINGVVLLDKLKAAVETGVGVKLRPRALHERVGRRGLVEGTHLTVFGRPEMGKSAFAITNAAGWAADGKRVAYFINEDPAVNISLRFVECLTGWEEDRVLDNLEEAYALAKRRGFDNIYVKDIHPGTAAEIDRFVVENDIECIVVDQLRNMSSKEDSRTNQLDAVARSIRDVGKKRNLVTMSITQAGDSAEGKVVLGMGDIDSSKTGIPGACDILLGIGANQEMLANNSRCITFIKNKTGGNHDSVSVRVNPHISRYMDI